MHIAAHTIMEKREAAALLLLAKYHTAQAAVMALLALSVGLVPQLTEGVLALWWLCLLGVPLFLVPIILTLTESPWLAEDPRLFIVYVLGQVLISLQVCAWAGRGLLMLSSFIFAGLFAQTTYYEVTEATAKLQQALGIPIATVLLLWLSAWAAMLPSWSLHSLIVLSAAHFASQAYVIVFTLGSFHRASTSGQWEPLGLWKSYAALYSWVRRLKP